MAHLLYRGLIKFNPRLFSMAPCGAFCIVSHGTIGSFLKRHIAHISIEITVHMVYSFNMYCKFDEFKIRCIMIVKLMEIEMEIAM